MAAPQANLNLRQTLDRIDSTSRMSRQDYLNLTHALLGGYAMTDDDYRRVNRCLDRLQNGRVTLAQS
ncbi:MAG: hypothetical protein AAF685_04850 [Cyanobacteria bacterium P01_C01_bin.89]